MTSVERVMEYLALEKEPLDIGKTKANENWPNKGEIIFSEVSFAYAKNLTPVLKEISFEIQPGEKIGIVGRTGAGKSSLIQTIFRLAEPNGQIKIDGINIKDLSLKDLRKKLSIIPVN